MAVAIVLASDPASLGERALAGAAGGFLLVAALRHPRAWEWATSSSRRCWGCSWAERWPAMLIALAAEALVGIVLMPMHGPGARKQAIPFGPSSPSAGWSGCWRVKTCSTPTWTPTRAEQAQARPPIGR